MTNTAGKLILGQLLDPVGECLTPAVAQRIAALRATPRTQQRLDRLAVRNAEGALTVREAAEYEAFVEALDVIAILQAKARKVLRSARRAR